MTTCCNLKLYPNLGKNATLMEKLPGLKSDELMSFGVILVHLPEPTPQEHLGKFHQEKWLLWPTSGSRH